MSALDRAIRQDIFSAGLLETLKRELLTILASASGKRDLSGLVMDEQYKTAQDIRTATADCIVRVEALIDLISTMPDYVSEKTAFLEFEDKYRRAIVDAARLSGDQPTLLDGLVGQGLLTAADVDAFKRAVGAKDTERSSITQTVRELRDRYYTVEKGQKVDQAGQAGSLEIISNGRKVEEVAGNPIVTFGPDGSIKIGERSGNVVNKRRIRKPKAPVLPNRTPVEDFSFEIVSCALLDLADYIESVIDSLNNQIPQFLKAISSLQSLKLDVSFGKMLPIPNRTLANISSIKSALNSVLSLPDLKSRTIGINVTLNVPLDGIPAGNGRNTVCEVNKKQYCAIHENLINIDRNLSADLESISLSLGSSLIDFDLDGMITKLTTFSIDLTRELNLAKSLISGLKRDICAFVSRRVRAIPKKALDLLSNLSRIVLLITTTPSFAASFFGVSVSKDMLTLINRLRAFGMNSSVRMLASGDIESFLGIGSEEESTMAGSTAKCLENIAGDDIGISQTSQVAILASASRTRASRQVAGAVVRQSMISRLGQDQGSSTAEAVYVIGLPIVSAV